ncbi:MAG: M23 family metallopeptidase [Treponema sp.]|jgi:murein DD-endopeptidase MepM/ murein hydrolase activator NlpD|nr:M23 family metallopeptidase [Treponema sp.]
MTRRANKTRSLRHSVSILIIIFFLLSSASACAQLKYAVIPENPRPGDPITIGANSGVTEVLLFVNDKQVGKAPFFYIPGERDLPGFIAAVITVPSTIDSGNVVIKLNNANGQTAAEIPIELTPREFLSEVIHLDPVNTGIRTDPSPERTQQANHLWQILITTGDQIYHTGPFLPPTTATRRTSFFGSRRIFQYSTGGRDTSIHAGVDFGVPTGTRVDACGAGKVVLARTRIVTGNSVVLEHGPGIYSLYYHLDRLNVSEGDMVQTGDLLGYSGSTGLSTGPHLHWEVRVNAENTDPDAFVERQIIDKDLLIRKMYNR